jgi:hypothetical protein
VEHSIAGVIDWVDAFETRLPPPDEAKHAKETHEEEYDKEEEPFNPPCPPQRRSYHDK